MLLSWPTAILRDFGIINQIEKTRHIAVTGFSYFKPSNVVVPTALESHSEMLHYLCVGAALCGARLRAVFFDV